jgi:hypothetical protein
MLLKILKSIYCGVDGMGQKNTFFEKQSGEVAKIKNRA